MPEKTLTSALWRGKCPHCRKGDIFEFKASRLSRFNKMNASCPHCGVSFEPEPGFYQGAMYVSYAFTIAVILIISLTLYILGNPSEWVYIGVIVLVMLLLVPLNFRYSQILYLHLFGGIKFDASR